MEDVPIESTPYLCLKCGSTFLIYKFDAAKKDPEIKLKLLKFAEEATGMIQKWK